MPKYSSTVISSLSGVLVIFSFASRDGDGAWIDILAIGFVVHSIVSIIKSFQFAKKQPFPDIVRKKKSPPAKKPAGMALHYPLSSPLSSDSVRQQIFDKPISLTSKKSVKRFQENTRNTHFVEKPPFLRSSFVRRPPFVRRRANKQWPYRRTTGPHAIPSLPLDKFLQLLVVVLAKLVTDGLYKIGQLALVAARFGPKDC